MFEIISVNRVKPCHVSLVSTNIVYYRLHRNMYYYLHDMDTHETIGGKWKDIKRMYRGWGKLIGNTRNNNKMMVKSFFPIAYGTVNIMLKDELILFGNEKMIIIWYNGNAFIDTTGDIAELSIRSLNPLDLGEGIVPTESMSYDDCMTKLCMEVL